MIRYLIFLIVFMLEQCGEKTSKNIGMKKETADKPEHFSDNISGLFTLLEEGKLDIFNKKVEEFPAEKLNILIEDRTLLMIAVEKGYKDIVERLIRKDVDVNVVNEGSETALYFAFKSNNEEIKELLLNNKAYLFEHLLDDEGIELEKEDSKKMNQNYFLVHKKTFDLFNELFVKEEKDEKKIKKLVEEGANLNIISLEDNLLILEYLYNKKKVQKFFPNLDLLERYGFNPNSPDSYILDFAVEVYENLKKDKDKNAENFGEEIINFIRGPKLNFSSLLEGFIISYRLKSNYNDTLYAMKILGVILDKFQEGIKFDSFYTEEIEKELPAEIEEVQKDLDEFESILVELSKDEKEKHLEQFKILKDKLINLKSLLSRKN